MTIDTTVKVGLAQLAPVWLNKIATIKKVVDTIQLARQQSCDLVVFGEAFIPGYPFWIELTDGARFESPLQKEFHAHYLNEAVSISDGDLDLVQFACKDFSIAAIVGCIERAKDRGGHSVYCTLVYIDSNGVIQSAHRKLMPTYEERLSWAPGDGHGLRVHPLKEFTVGALNCWENWMPMARTALYGLGEDLHVAIWPGSKRNTEDITRFIAKESRSFVVSVSALLRRSDITSDVPHHKLILENTTTEYLANGGSCVAAPTGHWLLEPVIEKEILLVAELNHQYVKMERQNFDTSGHYSRPDVLQLTVNRERQRTIKLIGD